VRNGAGKILSYKHIACANCGDKLLLPSIRVRNNHDKLLRWSCGEADCSSELRMGKFTSYSKGVLVK